MGSAHGRSLGLPRARRLVLDWLHFCRPTATITLERSIRIPEVAAARVAADPRPGWFAVLLKAYGLAAQAVPDLRRSLLTFPTSRLYEHGSSTALVTVERELDGDPAVLTYPLKSPESKSLVEIDAELARLKTVPLDEECAYRRALLLLRLPRPLRRAVMWLGLSVRGSWRQRHFGTFTASNVAPAGAGLVHGLTMLTSFLSPAVVDADGTTTLRLFVDHRVIDGAPAARGLVAMEAALRGPILAELRSLARPGIIAA
ncbi:MAG TPA: hypothetical protein VD866_16440 [Urbifossiella sp.]|nr:hypothetical protein [Urbifossiella sp.]